jgi:dethiobiotin synthetase
VQRIIVITGTDTGVGKTVLTALLAHYLRALSVSVAALKPICSGSRSDALLLRRAAGRVLPLAEINPWHFRAPLAPLLSARKQNARVELRDVLSSVHRVAHRYPVVLVEGAGGILSPLGEGFSTRELILGLGADVIVVARNQLGVVNHVRLTVEALPPLRAARARVALMSPPRPNPASRTNQSLLAEFVDPAHIASVPWVPDIRSLAVAATRPAMRAALDALLH